MRKPSQCHSKAEIRCEIDRLDRQLIALLAKRFGYVRRMAELKEDPNEAHVVDRVDEVLDKVGAQADAAGFDSDLARKMWRSLIDWNVDYERRIIAARKRRG